PPIAPTPAPINAPDPPRPWDWLPMIPPTAAPPSPPTIAPVPALLSQPATTKPQSVRPTTIRFFILFMISLRITTRENRHAGSFSTFRFRGYRRGDACVALFTS